jgi:hypothetical protein
LKAFGSFRSRLDPAAGDSSDINDVEPFDLESEYPRSLQAHIDSDLYNTDYPATVLSLSALVEGVLHGFVNWRDLAKERLEPNALFDPERAADTGEGRGWDMGPPSMHFWWIKGGNQLRKELMRFLHERQPTSTADGTASVQSEFEKVVVEQLLPAVAEAITPALLLEHVNSAQMEVGASNSWWERCLRVVQKTKLAAASPPAWPKGALS